MEAGPVAATPPSGPAFVPSLRRTLGGTFRYSGRAPRSDVIIYAIAALWLVPLMLSLGEALSGLTLPREAGLGIGALLALPFAALFVRRCHDSGRSGRWAALLLPGLLLPLGRGIAGIAGGISANLQVDRFAWPLDWLAMATNLAAVVLCLVPGSAGANPYGEDPRSD